MWAKLIKTMFLSYLSSNPKISRNKSKDSIGSINPFFNTINTVDIILILVY